MPVHIDDLIFSTATVRAGRFRCEPGHPAFRDSGPITGHIVVFPRTGVWIQHADSRPFVADPNIATIYNRGQEYSRRVLSPAGDRCEWFGVTPALASEIAVRCLPLDRITDDRPFTVESAACSPALYLRQRTIYRLLTSGALTGLAAEETIVSIVNDVISAASTEGRRMSKRRVTARHRDLAMNARMLIARDSFGTSDLAQLSAELGVSPFHLCRVFRAVTGATMHAWQMDLRLRAALEQLEGAPGAISRVAHACGFSSHSHLVLWCRRRFGDTPSRLQERLIA
ncbi:MAG: helix-turn-helix transcriptional regulator [Gemmatimonadota bacterium]